MVFLEVLGALQPFVTMQDTAGEQNMAPQNMKPCKIDYFELELPQERACARIL